MSRPTVSLLFALALAGCASVPPPPRTWTFTGYQLVERKCAGCHAIDMDHHSINSEAPPFRDLVRRYPVDRLDEAFAKGLDVGHYDMPNFTLPVEERVLILAYLHRLTACAPSSSDEAAMRRCLTPMADSSREPVR